MILWHLRYDYLVMMIAVAILLPTPVLDTAIATLSILGIGASVFIGFRNSNAYARWWEARTLWGSVIINSRSLNNGLVGFLLMATFITAERIGHLIEQPMRNCVFDLPLYRFCSTITGDLLGASHPLAKPRDAANALVWM